MSLPTVTRNQLINALSVTQLSLHSAYPGVTGTGELSGGTPAYVRKAVTVSTATGGIRPIASSVTFDVAAGTTVRWVGAWDGATFKGCAPNGGSAARLFSVVTGTDTIVSTSHGWSDGQKIVFFRGTPPGGLTEGTVYFVRDATTDTFKVAATAGGAAIDLTSGPAYECDVSAIVEDTYASQDTHTIGTSSNFYI